MPILLRRVDERLIHGQVVIGWGRHLRPDHYLVVDDAIAESDWEQELYLLALDGEADVTFVSVDEARDQWDVLEREAERTVLLVRDLETMSRLASGGLMAGEEVNLGGIHHSAGRVAVRPYLHLAPEDRTHIQELVEENVRVSGRDLPDAPAVTLDELLQG